MKTLSLPLSYHFAQFEHTEQFGAKLAQLCQGQCVIFLEGELGAGKTTFARGFIKQLSHTTRVKSPTYTLLEYYTTETFDILHIDCYRLTGPAELEAIGIRDYMQKPTIWLIEWPEKVTQATHFSLLPLPDLVLKFELLSNSHQLTLVATSKTGSQLMNAINRDA